MTQKSKTDPEKTQAQVRRDRLKAALKANMRKRKDQTRGRAKNQAQKD